MLAGKCVKTLSASGPFKRCILPHLRARLILIYSRADFGSNDCRKHRAYEYWGDFEEEAEGSFSKV